MAIYSYIYTIQISSSLSQLTTQTGAPILVRVSKHSLAALQTLTVAL